MTQRYRYTGTPSLTKDIKEGGVPTGELNVGECGTAHPVIADQPRFLWEFTSDRGFVINCPKHDLQVVGE